MGERQHGRRADLTNFFSTVALGMRAAGLTPGRTDGRAGSSTACCFLVQGCWCVPECAFFYRVAKSIIEHLFSVGAGRAGRARTPWAANLFLASWFGDTLD